MARPKSPVTRIEDALAKARQFDEQARRQRWRAGKLLVELGEARTINRIVGQLSISRGTAWLLAELAGGVKMEILERDKSRIHDDSR